MSAADEIIWHDLECGTYSADMAMWRELARDCAGPILDLGAGTGRVTIPLARDGHRVVAVDLEAGFLHELRQRADGLHVRTVCADVRELPLAERFGLILAPMQTVQLLGGGPGRRQLLDQLANLLAPAGLFAAALAEHIEPYDGIGPEPDVVAVDGVTYTSDPYAIGQPDEDSFVLHRRRTIARPGEPEVTSESATRIAGLSADELEEEAADAGLTVLPRLMIPATDEHVGSAVVMLGA